MSHDLQVLMADVLAGKSGSDVVLVDLLQQYGASRETALDFIHGLRLGSELESTLRDSVPVRAECSDRDDINMRITWTQDGRGHFVRLNLHGWLKESIS